MRLQWDASLHRLLEDVRVVFMPIVINFLPRWGREKEMHSGM